MGLDFVAVDFETANSQYSSACAMGLVFVRNGHIREKFSRLIRPPSRRFDLWNTRIHGITWEHVRTAPDFEEVWDEFGRRLNSQILIAHKADFDKRVLRACLKRYDIRYRLNPFVCSLSLSKMAFRFRHYRLPYVCRRLRISLQHHDPESDALAAAHIVLRAASRLQVRNAGTLVRLCCR
jgi:DNA polymerase III subunit epsilon